MTTEPVAPDPYEQIIQVMDSVITAMNHRFEHLESMHEQLEQVVAVLVPAYAELAATIEALVARVGSGSPEELEAFKKDAREGKRKLLELFTGVAQAAQQDPPTFQQFSPDQDNVE